MLEEVSETGESILPQQSEATKPVVSPVHDQGIESLGNSGPDKSKTKFYYGRKGFLVKRGMGLFFRPWALRHFILEVNQTLSYYCGDECKGTLALDGASVRIVPPEEANGNLFAFEVYNLKIEKKFKGDALMMAASSEQERKAWVKSLEAAVKGDLRSRTREGVGYESFAQIVDKMHNADILSLAGLRIDGRRCDEIRSMRHNIGFDKTLASDGSLYFEHGLNKVAVMVTGPHEAAKRAELQNVEKGKVVCHINQFLSLSQGQSGGADKKKRRNRGDRKTTEMEKIVEQTFSSVVMLEYYIKSEINIEVSVMESDGSLICCIVNAACMALVHAGIMMNDLVVACSAGVTANKLVCADLSQLEENSCYMPVAIKGRTKDILHMQLDARLSLDRLKDTMDTALGGCDQVLAYMDQHLRAYVLDSLERQ